MALSLIGKQWCDLVEQSAKELQEEIEVELQISDLTCFSLLDHESRWRFLFSFYWIGEVALFAAVSHIWDRLAEPRGSRCSQMGVKSGAGGTGKAALLFTLQKFLKEALEVDNPIPNRADFDTLDSWHDAAMAAFAADRSEVEQICRAYALVLDGGSLREASREGQPV